jgi:hypothetical protein
MTFKPLDLQMSVPRTQEFSAQHGQALHKPVADQTALADQSAKHTEQLRRQNTAVEHTTGQQIRGDQERNQEKQGHSPGKKQQEDAESGQSAEAAPVHPFKGHHLDIKL